MGQNNKNEKVKNWQEKVNGISRTMADLKFIVTEINKLLKTDYNLISFDSLPIANLVQILVDVLADFGALTKVKETRENLLFYLN